MTRSTPRAIWILFVVTLTAPAFGWQNTPPALATNLPAMDEDFAWQGEYLRQSRPGEPGWGVQVVALGQGTFRGALFAGGLPGFGATHGSRVELQGAREGEVISLRSADTSATVTVLAGGVARVNRGTGSTAELHKVERRSPTLGALPPACAIVLFDGHDTQAFRDGKMSSEGFLQVGTELIPRFRDFTMHLEFLLPYMPSQTSQARGNSGLYIQSRYEVQILDSFGLPGEFNECGSLYRYRAPDVNMCLPPLVWQTYDITFHAARFDRCGTKRCPARITVCHNGVIVQNNVVLERKTGAGQPEGPELLPTKLQDHHDPVQFRNIWIVPHDRAYLQPQILQTASHR